MKPDFSEVYARELAIIPIMNKVESVGLRFDVARAKKLNKPLLAEIEELQSFYPDVNYKSPKQLSPYLLNLGMPKKLITHKGKVTTAFDTLKYAISQLPTDRQQFNRVRHFVQTLLDFRELNKISSTYYTPLIARAEQNNGIIHTTIKPTNTVTGRMACENPSLHVIPNVKNRKTGKENQVRSCFICRDGCANYYYDYKQIEIVVLGLWMQDDYILRAYANGEDIHDTLARYIWADYYNSDPKFWRDINKAVTYGIVYGEGPRGLSYRHGWSFADAKKYYNHYINTFIALKRLQEQVKDDLKQYGEIWDWFGRRYQVPYNQAYKGVNAWVQGSCSQAFKIGLINTDQDLEPTSRILLPVHDEQVHEREINARQSELSCINRTQYSMYNIPQFLERGLHLQVDVERTDTNWAEKKEVTI